MDQQGETAAQRRRHLAAQQADPAPDAPAERQRRLAALQGSSSPPGSRRQSISKPVVSSDDGGFGGETAAERKVPPRTPGIRFAEQPRMPTKDERAANDAQEKASEKEEKEGKRRGLGKLFRK